MQWLLKLLGVDPIGKIVSALGDAYKSKLAAQNEEQRLVADAAIETLRTSLAAAQEQASVVKAGMQHRAFWIPWLIAAVPTAAWYGWGMADSLFNGTLPDVASLPPQLKEYADVVFANIFYVGGGVAGLGAVAQAIRGRK